MDSSVVHILGASGSGTSTLGRAMAEQWGYAWLDTDDFFWQPTDPPYAQPRPVAERIDRLRAAIAAAPRCAISGSLCGWGECFIPQLTLTVWLQTPTAVRLARLRTREAAAFGARIAPGGDMHEAHERFIAWAATYDTAGPQTRSVARHAAWTAQLPCPVLQLDGTEPPQVNLARIRQALDRARGDAHPL